MHEHVPNALLHRDVKAENVLLADGMRRVVLADLGTAKQVKLLGCALVDDSAIAVRIIAVQSCRNVSRRRVQAATSMGASATSLGGVGTEYWCAPARALCPMLQQNSDEVLIRCSPRCAPE